MHGLAKRIFDVMVASISLLVFAVPMLAIAIAVVATSRGPVLYWSDRVGRSNRLFRMPKFRSMYVGTPPVATHLLATREPTSLRSGSSCDDPAWTNSRSFGACSSAT